MSEPVNLEELERLVIEAKLPWQPGVEKGIPAPLLVAAVNALPELIAEVKRLRAGTNEEVSFEPEPAVDTSRTGLIARVRQLETELDDLQRQVGYRR